MHKIPQQYSKAANPEEIFLSYSRSDEKYAAQLLKELVLEGFNVFRDQESIRIGENWMQCLQDAVQGCKAFILLVGIDGVQQQRWVGAEVEAALTRKLSPFNDDERLSIYPILLPEAKLSELPVFLNQIQTLSWAPEIHAIPPGLVDQLSEKIGQASRETQVFTGQPYRGLSYFREQDADRFFGRHEEALEALRKLGYSEALRPSDDNQNKQTEFRFYRWLQIHASSGSGKSSLVRAGLLPKIRQGALWRNTGYQDWVILDVMMPGKKPMEMLAQVLARAFPEKGMMNTWLTELSDQDQPQCLSFAIRSVVKEGQAVLLVVDQFEELFTQSEVGEYRQFDRLLAAALSDPNCPFFLISAIRSDFMDQFENLPQLLQLYNHLKSEYLLPTISESGLRELITLPAKLSGLLVGEDLTEVMIRDSRGEPGTLPLVESALLELAIHAQNNGNKYLSKNYYDKSLGVVGMLSKQADSLINALSEKKRKDALNLLLALTQINEGGRHTRRRLLLEDAVHVAGGGKKGEAIVKLLAGKHNDQKGKLKTGQTLPLITTGQAGDESYVELVHEMLVREKIKVSQDVKSVGYWPTLFNFIHENRDRDSHNQQLKIQAQRWHRSGLLGRYFSLAGWQDLRVFKGLNPRKKSVEGRFLKWSFGIAWMHGILFVIMLVLGESALWTVRMDLPLNYVLIRPLWMTGLYQPKPEMTIIPSGSFVMGCQDGRDNVDGVKNCGDKATETKFPSDTELPTHQVVFKQPFLLGKYEITFIEFDYFVWDHGSKLGISYPSDQKWGRHRMPVVNVSWKSATLYAKWLSEKTGKKYRLPTEAEWEYAARANTNLPFPWGKESGQGHANCRGCNELNPIQQTSPTGSFQENPFDLHDMHGNVWEWVQDCWYENYSGAVQDGTARDAKDCQYRTLRGGSWRYDAYYMRSSYRNNYRFDKDSNRGGFRIACTASDC